MKLQKLDSKYLIQINRFGIIAALFFGAAIVFYSCSPEVEKIEAFSSPENLPVVYAEDFETTFTDSFKIQFYMKAPVLQKFESDANPFLEFPNGILIIKYDSNGEIISRITSDYAREYEKEQR
ncbi:MAG: hypothetical protein HQ541_11875, partial [Mariniphaga sp.]|nr:hypothetical protein [Mariniphaga sp.]